MSSPLAIGAVSAVLRNLLDTGFIEQVVPALGTTVNVTVQAPDAVKLDDPTSSPQLNLFLHQVTPNPGWRNRGLPSRNSAGERMTNPPLALDLHYLLTAYGKEDFQAEILLGYAMHLLHERPVLDRPAIRRALSPGPLDASILPPAFQALSASDLADQVESVKIIPETMNTEEMSKLWSALQAHYRPSAAYRVSVVLIEAVEPTHRPLPVMSRGEVDPTTGRDRGIVAQPDLVPPFPTILSVEPPSKQKAAVLGNTVVLRGHHLDGANVAALFEHTLLEQPIPVLIGTNAESDKIDVPLPDTTQAREDWPTGMWSVSVSLERPGETKPRETNVAAMLLAPVPSLASAPVAPLPTESVQRDPATQAVTIDLHASPEVRPTQLASLTLGGTEALAESHPSQTSALRFVFPSLGVGDHWLRLRVGGVDSLLIDRSDAPLPPKFDDTQKVDIPA